MGRWVNVQMGGYLLYIEQSLPTKGDHPHIYTSTYSHIRKIFINYKTYLNYV